ncbi:uncharacterized protein CLUP02_15143 [Colletotrichum lupini]|uniref:Uncharacterized protein n=1 Tax=Colletotrichum lupini TaxID=145971 RepID=A0A9Q8T7F4_9PEZI|nr:uncharacterized protein CLUP02_15143 [Colletotrichum lupini]UQC89612.1 hypothetical protein CLUP02_15143 [Colletotrichum lupini]
MQRMHEEVALTRKSTDTPCLSHAHSLSESLEDIAAEQRVQLKGLQSFVTILQVIKSLCREPWLEIQPSEHAAKSWYGHWAVASRAMYPSLNPSMPSHNSLTHHFNYKMNRIHSHLSNEILASSNETSRRIALSYLQGAIPTACLIWVTQETNDEILARGPGPSLTSDYLHARTMLRPRLSLFSLPRSHLNMHSMLLSDSFTVHESQRNRTPTCLSGIHVRGTGRSPESFSNRPVLFPHPTWGDGRKAWTHENVGSFRSSVQQHEKNFAVEIRGYSRRDFFYQNGNVTCMLPPIIASGANTHSVRSHKPLSCGSAEQTNNRGDEHSARMKSSSCDNYENNLPPPSSSLYISSTYISLTACHDFPLTRWTKPLMKMGDTCTIALIPTAPGSPALRFLACDNYRSGVPLGSYLDQVQTAPFDRSTCLSSSNRLIRVLLLNAYSHCMSQLSPRFRGEK